MAKKLPNFETWSPLWQINGWNYCFVHAADALDYLAKHDRPIGGEQHYNYIDCIDTATDIRRTIEAIEDYKKRLTDGTAKPIVRRNVNTTGEN